MFRLEVKIKQIKIVSVIFQLFFPKFSHFCRRTHIQDKNLYKSSYQEQKKSMTLKPGMQYRILEYYQICSNDDPGLTLTYFTARSNLLFLDFYMGKAWTVDFSEIMYVCVTKLGVYSQQNKYMKIYECQRSRSFNDLCPRSLSFQQFQTSSTFWLIEAKFHLPGTSMELGNEILFKWSRSHEQDGRHAHIW